MFDRITSLERWGARRLADFDEVAVAATGLRKDDLQRGADLVTVVLLSLLSATAVAAEPTPLGDAAFRPSPTRAIGWRGDGTGHFPGATPPTEWDLEKNENIRWRVELPGPSDSSVIVVGDAVFAVAAPHHLHCLDATSGEVRWQTDLDPAGLLAGDEAGALRAELEALLRQRDELAAGGSKDKQKKTAKKIAKRIEALAHRGVMSPSALPRGLGTICRPTPASDGERVYVQSPAGVVAAFSLTGERLWRAAAVPDGWSIGNSSPVVYDGKVLAIAGKREGGPTLYCFDAATGATLWEQRFASADHCGAGSPVVVSTGDGPKAAVPVHKIFDLATGDLWREHDAYTSMGATPVVDGSRIVYVHGDYSKKSPCRLVVVDCHTANGAVTAEPRGSAGNIRGSALVVDGKAWVPDVNGAGPEIWELAQMKAVFHCDRKRPLVANKRVRGLAPSPAFAGGHIYQALADGQVLIYTPTVPPKVVAVNRLEPQHGSPFFHGDAIYFRTRTAVVCVGP